MGRIYRPGFYFIQYCKTLTIVSFLQYWPGVSFFLWTFSLMILNDATPESQKTGSLHHNQLPNSSGNSPNHQPSQQYRLHNDLFRRGTGFFDKSGLSGGLSTQGPTWTQRPHQNFHLECRPDSGFDV